MDAGDFELDVKTVRKTYLVTYSQADLSLFPSRESFANCVVEAFSYREERVRVVDWVCSMEEHNDGGKHYHLAIKLSDNKRWKPAKLHIMKNHGIVVNFSDRDDNYYTAYKYVVKEDKEALHSPNHTNLADCRSPRTKRGTQTIRKSKSKKRANASEGRAAVPKKRRLSNLAVSEIILKNDILNETQLLAHANEQKENGKIDLAEWVLAKPSKGRNELISSTWNMKGAAKTLERQSIPRMEIIRQNVKKDCVPGCSGLWLKSAKEVLRNNKVHSYVFADAVRLLLEKGRGKYRNILIVGPANCGKTFLLEPLKQTFSTFLNPATTTYAWLGVENAEIILMNDFRWSRELIAWNYLLLLLEGQGLHFPAPKSQYAHDIFLDRDTPIFATSKSRVEFAGKYNASDPRETEMMEARWRTFQLTYQIPEGEQKSIVPCARCFAELVLLGSDI